MLLNDPIVLDGHPPPGEFHYLCPQTPMNGVKGRSHEGASGLCGYSFHWMRINLPVSEIPLLPLRC